MANSKTQPLYNQEIVQPMRDELIAVGFIELRLPIHVDHIMKTSSGILLIVINSICGCAADSARPGVSLALQNDVIPDHLYTVFAGQERDTLEKLRTYITAHTPSSPSVAMFENKKLIYFLPRFEIEGCSKEEVANKLIQTFNLYCKKKGPSVSPEQYRDLLYAKEHGLQIPINRFRI